MKLIKQIKSLDKAIAENTKRIDDINLSESDLAHALKKAQQNESELTKKYISEPTEKSQDALELARDFTTSCNKRVTLFINGSTPILNDTKKLWQRRKILLKELADIRIKETRESLEKERQDLINTLYPNAIRLILLTHHLDGAPLLQLDLNRILENYNGDFKAQLDQEKIKLNEQFEALT